MRSDAYLRLRRSWNFINEMKFYEIGNLVTYGVHIYASPRPEVDFLTASGLYHPDTVSRSLAHDGSGPAPGMKDERGRWNLAPHRSRIIRVTRATLESWHSLMEEEGVPLRQTRMVYVVNSSASNVLSLLGRGRRVAGLNLFGSRGWSEKSDRVKGYFTLKWEIPESWSDTILQGPHLHLCTPMYKSPNKSLRSHRDWTANDLSNMAVDAVPATAYQPTGRRSEYDAAYGAWGSAQIRDYYRIAWRRMANNTGERTLLPALIPPGAAHVHPVSAAGSPELPLRALVAVQGFLTSLLADLFVRSTQKGDIYLSTLNRFPIDLEHGLNDSLALRVLRLNSVTDAFGELWQSCFLSTYVGEAWASGRDRQNRPT